MDIISFNEASTANGRIESFIENPDSSSGIVTVPKTIASGETITIPAGRVAVLPNLVVDGTLNIEGEVFIPSGATFDDLDTQIALKADTSYVNTQLGLKQNVLITNDAAVKTALNASGDAPIYACRAWVDFNGTGTVAIKSSGNTSSITDNGVGLYTQNFTIAMPDVNFVGTPSSLQIVNRVISKTVSSISIGVGRVADLSGNVAYQDDADVMISVVR